MSFADFERPLKLRRTAATPGTGLGYRRSAHGLVEAWKALPAFDLGAGVDLPNAVMHSINRLDASPIGCVEDVPPEEQCSFAVLEAVQVATFHQTPGGLSCQFSQLSNCSALVHIWLPLLGVCAVTLRSLLSTLDGGEVTISLYEVDANGSQERSLVQTFTLGL